MPPGDLKPPGGFLKRTNCVAALGLTPADAQDEAKEDGQKTSRQHAPRRRQCVSDRMQPDPNRDSLGQVSKDKLLVDLGTEVLKTPDTPTMPDQEVGVLMHPHHEESETAKGIDGTAFPECRPPLEPQTLLGKVLDASLVAWKSRCEPNAEEAPDKGPLPQLVD